MNIRSFIEWEQSALNRIWNHQIHWKALIKRLIIGLVILAAIIVIGYMWDLHIPQIEAFIKSIGIWGPLIFMLLFIILMPFFVPNAGFAMIAGVLFGLWWGTIYVVIAGLIAELILFSLGHKILRSRVDKMLESYPKLLAIRKALIKKPIKLMILLRLSPIPFTPICYLLSTTRISYKDYIIGYTGFIPGNFVTVYFGFVAKHVAKFAGNVDNISPGQLILAIVGLVSSVILITYISHVSKKAIEEVEKQNL